jgi:hypothetical protein
MPRRMSFRTEQHDRVLGDPLGLLVLVAVVDAELRGPRSARCTGR